MATMKRVTSYDHHPITMTTKLQQLPLHDKSLLISPSMVNWLAQTEALLWTRCQSIFVAVVLFSFVPLGQFVCHSLIIFFFFSLCIQVGRGDSGDDGAETTPAVGTGVTAAGECTDTLHHCVDISVALTSED